MCLGEPARVIELDPELPELAVVERAGTRERINIGLIDPGELSAGDWVLVHIGFAVRRMEPDEAEATRDFVQGLIASRPDEALLTWDSARADSAN